jgi:probable phosphoglycerate mutase
MTNATELILIRHGETDWNRERRMQGQLNTPLSDLGRAQAAAVGRRLASHSFTAIYSSDLQRAWDTATPIAQASGHKIITEPRLRERTFGMFEGLTYPEMAQRHPALHARYELRDPDYTVPGGETPRQFFERTLGCLEEIAAAHAGERVVVVTHGLVLDTLYRAARNMPLEVKREAPLLNASLNTFQRSAEGWTEIGWGDVEHLAGVGVTRFHDRAV